MATKTPLAEYAGIFRVMASGDTIPAAIVPTLNQNTTGSAATLTTARTLTIGSTSKAFDGSANVAWSRAEIGVPWMTSTVNVTAENTEAVIGYIQNPLFGVSDGALYSHVYSSIWKHQIQGDYRTGQIAVRGKNNGTWQAWRVVLDNGNFNDYTPTKTGTGASGTWGISITGNAATATKLQTARTINGTSFDGSTNITTANWGTARTITIGGTGKSVNGSTNYSWTLAEIGAQAALGYTPVNKAGDTMTGALAITAADAITAQTPASTQSAALFNKWGANRNFGIGTEADGTISFWQYNTTSDAYLLTAAQFKKNGDAVFAGSVYANYTDRLIKSDGGDVLIIKKMTASAYAALGTKDANTLYVIVG